LKIQRKYLNILSRIKSVLKNPENKSFFVAGHLNPDGDTIGGMLALDSFLKRLNKRDVSLYNYHSVPAICKFLKNYQKIKISDKIDGKFDVAIIIDCSDSSRIGGIIDPSKQAKTTIKIDHHADNNKWADINWSASNFSSVAEMIFMLFKFFGFHLTKEEAEYIYTGIVTDTHNFTQVNTNPQSHYIAAELLENGVDPVKIEKNIYGTKTLSALRILGKTLESITIHKSGRVAYAIITNDIFEKTGAKFEDTEGIINYIGMIPGAYVWALFKEMPDEKSIKVGLRSIEKVDINKIAKKFGGGGHKNAAGCTLNMPLDEAIRTVIPRINKYLKKINA